MADGKILTGILNSVHKLLFCKGFKDRSLVDEKYFSRPSRCKLTFQMLTAFILSSIKKSIQIEMDAFLNEVGLSDMTYSKQAFSKRRKCVKWEAIRELFQVATSEFYQKADYNTYKGYVLIAVDGSKINLPDSDELKSVFGEQVTVNVPQNQALASCAYDVLNEMFLDAILAPCKSNERDLAIQHFENIKDFGFKKSLYIFDRGYPSADLMKNLLENGHSFLFRCNKTFIDEKSLPGNDCIIDHRFYRKNYTMQFRVVRFALDSGTEETLITNLPSSEVSLEELKQLYHLRWGIETSYNCAKHVLTIEDFSGTSEIAVRQDFFATFFLYNLASVNIFEQTEAFDEAHNSKGNKYQYQQNRAATIGELRPAVTKLVLSRSRITKDAIMIKIYLKTIRCTTRVHPNRQFSRNKKHRSMSAKMNCRRVL